MRKSLNIFSTVACNSIIASNKQRQDDNNLATTKRANFKKAHERSKSLHFIKT